MPAFLSGVKPAIKNLFNTHKSLDTWIENVTTSEICEALTKVYLKGDVEENVAPALTSEEHRAFTKNFEAQTGEPQGSILEIGAFYAGYPFALEPLPLSHDGFLRAVVALTGKDKALYEKSVVSHAGTERIIRRGRDNDDKIRLLFAALSGGSPTTSDVLDVLSLVQPRPDTTRLPKGHNELTVAANRLAPNAASASMTTIPAAKTIAFFRDINVDPPVLTVEVVDMAEFKKLLVEKPETFDSLAKQAGAYLAV